MKLLYFLILLSLITSCTTEKKQFKATQVCSDESVRYLKRTRYSTKRFKLNPYLIDKIAKTKDSMQLCYEDFRNRTGHEEDFNTCLVVGVDENGVMDFYNFSSREAPLDQAFMDCAHQVMGRVDFSSYGWNYVMVHTYKFYYE